MAEYELVYEIKNLCRNNQMRDVFFEEVECDDPEEYLRGRLKGKTVEFSTEKGAGGSVTIHAVVDGLIQKYAGLRGRPLCRFHDDSTERSAAGFRADQRFYQRRAAHHQLQLRRGKI